MYSHESGQLLPAGPAFEQWKGKRRRRIEELPDSAMKLAEALTAARGVVGVVLGGSRTRGRNGPKSDVDLGLYYDAESLDWATVASLLEAHDDTGTPRGLAPPGAWGPWMNGGAWLQVDDVAVNVLLRDIRFVEGVAGDVRNGSFSSEYLPGFPHGWHSFMLVGEVFYSVPLTGDLVRLRALRESIAPYPEALRRTVIDRFLYEARFSALMIQKLVGRDEQAFVAGLLYRCAMCMVHVIAALNRTYLVNEKGAVAVVAGLEHAPPEFSHRIDEALGPEPLTARIKVLVGLVDEVELLVRTTVNLVTTWDASSFPNV